MKPTRLLAVGLALGLSLGGLMPMAFATTRPPSALITLDMLTAQQGWAMNTAGQILKTTDGGHQWTNAGNPALARAIHHAAQDGSFYLHGPTPGGHLVASSSNNVAFPNAWTAWLTLPVAGNAIQVWHTGNGGRHWTRTTIHRIAPPSGTGLSDLAAVGNQDAWIMAATQGLAGHVDFRVWRTSIRHRHWHAVFQGTAPNTAGMVFATGAIGILAEGSNIIDGPRSAALAVTPNGGQSWAFTGDRFVGETQLPPTSALPLLPGSWATTVLDPIVIPRTQNFIVAVLMQKPLPSKTAPLKTWWRLDSPSHTLQTRVSQ